MSILAIAIAIGIATNVAVGDNFSINRFGIKSKGLGVDGTGSSRGR